METDYLKMFGVKDGSRFVLLLEKRPKWLLLLLHLRKSVRLSFKEARNILKMDHSSLLRAIQYLGGISIKSRKREVGYITSMTSDPLIAVEALSYKEKYIVLTEYGRSFTDKIVDYLKDVVLTYGKVDVEKDLRLSWIEVVKVLQRSLPPNVKPDDFLEKLVSIDKVVSKLANDSPRLLYILKPELIGLEPVEIITPMKKFRLFVLSS